MTKNNTHPIEVIEYFLETHPEVVEVELSVYSYKPQTVTDMRVIHKVKASQLRSTFNRLKKSISEAEEIAFHSRVYVDDGENIQVKHFPLVDFHSRRINSATEKIIEVVQEIGCQEALICSSGRSFHLYGLKLLTYDDWIDFMGRILLLNLPDEPEIIDCRWVGHRLRARYGSLRWTKNTKQYLDVPTVLNVWSMNSYRPSISYRRPKSLPLLTGQLDFD
jgi:hypothetical protein